MVVYTFFFPKVKEIPRYLELAAKRGLNVGKILSPRVRLAAVWSKNDASSPVSIVPCPPLGFSTLGIVFVDP